MLIQALGLSNGKDVVNLMPPRLKDIAEAAGVDIGTVSHVLNRRPKADCLRAETREKILRIAEELGYCRNEMAASVAKKHGNVLAFICEDMGAVDYTGRIQNGILEEAASRDYAVIVYHLKKQNQDEILRKIIGWRTAGVIFHISDLKHASGMMKLLDQQSIPYGTANLTNPNGIGVTTDDYNGMRLAVECLKKSGSRNPAFFTYDTPNKTVEYLNRRQEGFRKAVEEVYAQEKIYSYFRPPLESETELGSYMQRFFEDLKQDKCDGIVCASDLLAMELLQSALANGIRIPEQLPLVGYGDLAAAAMMIPSLSSVSQNFEKIGIMVTRLVMEAIEKKKTDRESCNLILPVRLIERASTNVK